MTPDRGSTLFHPLSSRETSPLTGYTLAVFSSLSTAGVVILGKWVMTSGDPIYRGGLVVFIAGLMLSAGAVYKDGLKWLARISLRGWILTSLYTFFSIIAIAGFWLGLSLLPAAQVSFIGRLQVVFVVIFGVMLLREKFNIYEVFAGILAFIGTLILHYSIPAELSAGFWILLVSSLMFGIVEIIAKITVDHCEPYHFNTVRNLVVGIVLILWAVFKGSVSLDLGSVWYGIIAMAFLGPVCGRVFYLYALRHAGVTKISLVGQIQPVFVVLMAIVFLRDYPGGHELLGGGLILCGCAAVILSHPGNAKRLFHLHKFFQ